MSSRNCNKNCLDLKQSNNNPEYPTVTVPITTLNPIGTCIIYTIHAFF